MKVKSKRLDDTNVQMRKKTEHRSNPNKGNRKMKSQIDSTFVPRYNGQQHLVANGIA